MGCKENRMDVGFLLCDGKLEVYPSEQGIKLEVCNVQSFLSFLMLYLKICR